MIIKVERNYLEIDSIKDLKPDPQNARKRTDRSASLIQESIQRYGTARSIVIDEDNRILAGNGTVEGAKALGLENIKVIETDGSEGVASVNQTAFSSSVSTAAVSEITHSHSLSEYSPPDIHSSNLACSASLREAPQAVKKIISINDRNF